MKIEDHMTTQVVLKALGLKEHTLYKVLVRCTEDNIEHIAFLFVGFLTGSYTEVYNQTYEKPMRLIEMYSVEVIADLGSTKDIPMTMDHNIDKAMEGAPFDTDEEQFPREIWDTMNEEQPSEIDMANHLLQQGKVTLGQIAEIMTGKRTLVEILEANKKTYELANMTLDASDFQKCDKCDQFEICANTGCVKRNPLP